jgi:hypothetical protein
MNALNMVESLGELWARRHARASGGRGKGHEKWGFPIRRRKSRFNPEK